MAFVTETLTKLSYEIQESKLYCPIMQAIMEMYLSLVYDTPEYSTEHIRRQYIIWIKMSQKYTKCCRETGVKTQN